MLNFCFPMKFFDYWSFNIVLCFASFSDHIYLGNLCFSRLTITVKVNLEIVNFVVIFTLHESTYEPYR